jgi:hypothetical protein
MRQTGPRTPPSNEMLQLKFDGVNRQFSNNSNARGNDDAVKFYPSLSARHNNQFKEVVTTAPNIDGQGGGGSGKEEVGGSRGNNTTRSNNNNRQHSQQSNRMQYRLEEDGGSNGNDGGLGKCEGTMVDAVGGMATTRERKGQL